MAIFIAAIALVIVNMSFFQAHRSIEAVSSQRQAYQMVRIVMDRMVKDLTCAYIPAPGDPPRQMTEEQISLYRFVGKDEKDQKTEKDSIRFTTTADLGLPGSIGGLCEVGYYLKEMEDSKDRYVLVRSEDCLPHFGLSTTPKEMDVAEDIVSMDIKYVDGDLKEQDTWDLSEALTLPKQVKVTITFDMGGEQVSFSGVAFLPLSGLKLQKAQEGKPG
jgi:hypothetical protein